MDVAYDCEIYPNYFSIVIIPLNDDREFSYELSERRNDTIALRDVLRGGYFRRMFGFNNLNFDYPLLHRFLQCVDAGYTWDRIVTELFNLCNQIIATPDGWSHRVKPWDVIIPQGDLMLIHHLDNVARRTSLKTLEFNMRWPSLEEIPIKPGTVLTHDQMTMVLAYNANDTRATKRLAQHTAKMIAFRDAIGPEHLNHNDTKIGKQFFVQELERRQPGVCYDENRQPRQTWRPSIALGDVILPWIRFDRPELQAMADYLRGQIITETKGIFKGLSATVDGFRFDFGVGGIHGSVTNREVHATDGHVIRDIDVTSFYPAIAIVNRLFPQHLGPLFCDVYTELRDRRVRAKRAGDKVQADALKLANNGVYGDSNNMYAPFYDPAYTMAITVNGQLLLCMLAERVMAIPGAEIVQINTDGLSVRLLVSQLPALDAACDWWQRGTALELEHADYAGMWVRDVNNYLGLYSDHAMNGDKRGTVKRKGAYDYEMKVGDQVAWWKDFSGLVIPRAAEAALIHDHDPLDFIAHHTDVDPWDFMLRAKVNRGSRLQTTDGAVQQSTIRYFVATSGPGLVKIMPPIKASKGVERRIGIHAEGTATCRGARGAYACNVCDAVFPTKELFEGHNREAHGWRVQIRNQFAGDITGVDLQFYVREAEKLLLT